MIRLVLVVALLLAPAVVRAQEVDHERWTTTDTSARPKAVDISVPRSAGPLRLTRLKSVLNNPADLFASYVNADGSIFSTVYIYRAGHPDTTYGMRMTSQAVRTAFPGAVPQADAVATVAGTPAMLRRAFTGGQTRILGRSTPGRSLAGLIRAGDWIVKLRVTGADADRAAVDAAFDALAAGLAFGPSARPQATALEPVSSCPETQPVPPPRRLSASDADLGAILRRGVNADTAGRALSPRRLCSMWAEDLDGYKEILSEEGLGVPRAMLLNDAGDALVILSAPNGPAPAWWLVAAYRDRAELYGPYDRAPSAGALADIFRGREDWSGPPRAVLSRDAEGRIQITAP